MCQAQTDRQTDKCSRLGQQIALHSLPLFFLPPSPPNITGEERRIREFYQSRGLERGSQASHEGKTGPPPAHSLPWRGSWWPRARG